jgi:hypothetical protein
MARYIGPKTKIARKFGAAIYGDDKNFEKEKTNHQDNTVLTKEEVLKNLNMQFS